ncbi:hotdog fold thioesterase [Rubrivirga sp. IMCC43871]|uniref:hotdog fold thioesterase n=1 Tax=Rubrivirga sp. IMCC43871 TaxID=3391575 RepID=UPI0039902714
MPSVSNFSDSPNLGDTLGIEVVEAGPERCVATMPVDSRHHQPLGYLHGGATVALAETVASVGAYLAAPEGYTAFGQEINANHLRSMREGTLTAVGTPIHVGRTSQVWGIEVTDQDGRMICISRCTLAVVPVRAE